LACSCCSMDWKADYGDSEMTEQKKRRRLTPEATYITLRLPVSIAETLYALADAKRTTRNRLISNILHDFVEAEKPADVSQIKE